MVLETYPIIAREPCRARLRSDSEFYLAVQAQARTYTPSIGVIAPSEWSESVGEHAVELSEVVFVASRRQAGQPNSKGDRYVVTPGPP